MWKAVVSPDAISISKEAVVQKPRKSFETSLRNEDGPVNQEDNDDDNKEVEKLTEEEEEGVLGVLVVKVHLDRSVSAEKHCYIGQIK